MNTKNTSFQEFAKTKINPNEKGRSKIESNVRQDIVVKADHIFEEFKNYTDGVRVLFLMHRSKEGGETNNSRIETVITQNPEDFRDELIKLVDKKERENNIPYRIYSSVNSRNIKKAIKQFKYEQLDAEYYGEKEHNDFYFDIKNRFVGCLMQPAQRLDSQFIFDCDNEEGRDVHGEALAIIPDEFIILSYKTKNGWHIITVPHNHTLYQLPKNVEMKKDGLILLAF